MNNFSSFGDEVGEKVLEQGKKIVKKNVTSQGNKIDPTTGKPVPSKKILTQLNQQVAQLAQMRLKKVREELAAQRLKKSQASKTSQTSETIETKEKPKDNIVQKTLKGSKSTGEFKGLIGG